MLAFFRPAAEQDYKPVTILAEVNPVAGTEIDAVLENPGADAPLCLELAQNLPQKLGECWAFARKNEGQRRRP
jgi:hypothetical protein